MSENSPIHEELGCELDGEATQALETIRQSDGAGKTVSQVATEWEKRQKVDLRSLSVLQQLASAQAMVDVREYRKVHMVEYAVDWEQVVTERVEKELKNVRKLQGDRSHYEKKVENMRKRDNELQAKGKSSPAAQREKLESNETKLEEASMLHEAEAGRLCVLLEAVTQEGWKDLYILAKNYMKWEFNRVGRESDIYSQLPRTLDSMKTKTDTKKKSTARPW
jgi:hypothetical protein